MGETADHTWQSADGLKLHCREYGAGNDAGRPPVLCLPGLTRNGRDFANLAQRLSPQWRVLCPDLRGRGDSDYARDAASYSVPQYLDDIGRLLAELGIARFVAIGTSLGGIMTMVLAMLGPERIAGALLNDIGPVLEREGLERIRSYVGQGRTFPTWMHAARALSEVHAANHPDFTIDDWLGMAKRTMTLTSVGRITFDYDMKIAQEVLATDLDAAPPDLWPGLEALRGRPVLLLRGELSTLLSPATLLEMGRRLPDAEVMTVPRIGHTPTLDEPAVVAATDRLMERVLAAG